MKTPNTRFRSLVNHLSSRNVALLAAVILTGVIGSYFLVASKAATPAATFEAEGGTITSPAIQVTDATASGGKAVKFMAAVSSGTCQGAANTPGGADPWGGCWPGEFNTGYPHGLPGDTRTPVTLTNYTGSCTIAAGTTVVIDSKTVNCPDNSLVVYGTLTVKNSKVNGIVYENSNNAVLTIMDSEVNGGNQTTFPTIGGAMNITVLRVNAYLGQHTIQCYGNCNVQDSWLHDQFEAGTGPHQNGFLSNDGHDYMIRHNTAHCTTTGCTGDVAFTDDGPTYNAVIDRNLFMPAPGGSYCIYPGAGPKGNPMYKFTVTDNIFKRGANNKCGVYGPVYGFDPPQTTTPGANGYMNVWSGNRWEDGGTVGY